MLAAAGSAGLDRVTPLREPLLPFQPVETQGPEEAQAGGILSIDLAAIVANWRKLAWRAAGAECAAVVKANAYGCGIEPVTRALAHAGCRTFFVATLDEARSVRHVAPAAQIYVLNGLFPGTARVYPEHDLRPVLCSLDELAEWQGFIVASGWGGSAALQVDTGMNRLGLRVEEAEALARGPPLRAPLSLLLSHFACSEDAPHPANARQLQAFAAVRALFPGVPASLANSSGIFLGPEAHYDLVRPGVALYGANPTPGHTNPMQPVVTLQGRVVQVRRAGEGECVGYGATWTARRASRLAIISVGYADGFSRAASAADGHAGAEAIVADRRCPLAGRISMDLLAIDVTDVPEQAVRRGDFVTLLGEDISVDELAARSGTIAYEVLTRLGSRYRRIYSNA